MSAARETAPPPAPAGMTYYGLPAVKPSPFEWHTGAYLFVSGLGGGAQVLAGIAAAVGGAALRPVVRNGRYLALAAALAGAALLVADLKTPRRWYHMLRIFRRTSPMSIGTYVLTAFGASSALAALGEYGGRSRPRWRALAAAVQGPASLAGAGMMAYSGAVLAASSNPLWASDAGTLTPRLASGALATAAAALSLAERVGGRPANAQRLDAVALAGTAAHAALTATAKARRRAAGVATALEERPWGALQTLGDALSIALPLGCAALAHTTRPSYARALSVVASLGILAGTALKRWNYVNAGNASARRPEAYLRYAGGVSAADERAPDEAPLAAHRARANREAATA